MRAVTITEGTVSRSGFCVGYYNYLCWLFRYVTFCKLWFEWWEKGELLKAKAWITVSKLAWRFTVISLQIRSLQNLCLIVSLYVYIVTHLNITRCNFHDNGNREKQFLPIISHVFLAHIYSFQKLSSFL